MILELKKLSKSFGSIKVLKNINLKIDNNECVGIIGPNGAGKSTLFNVIAGHLKHDIGDVIYKNININNKSNEQRARLGIVQSFQKNSMFPEMTVLESIMLAISHRLNITFQLFTNLNSNIRILNEAFEIIKNIGLDKYSNSRSDALAYGLQRQLEIGIAIACSPTLLLLDEPTAGMSPLETKNIIRLIKNLYKNYTIVIVEHDMEVIYNLAHRIYVLDRGKIIFNGGSEEIKNSKLVQDKYLGIENV